MHANSSRQQIIEINRRNRGTPPSIPPSIQMLTRQIRRLFCSPVRLDESLFESLALRELQTIADSLDSRFDALGCEAVDLHEGVLSVEFPGGTFVINKHSASGQIWYSSPVSPPRYFEAETDAGRKWWSIRGGESLREKFSQDLRKLLNKKIELD
jgi:frataxin-like iron-binding protein CyaY